jgi:hypothetical protein
MNDIQEIYAELVDLYPNLNKALDAPRDEKFGTWWLDCGEITIVYFPTRKEPFEIAACPPGCGSENHVFEYGGDVFFKTKEEVLTKVRYLIDNNKYTHELSKEYEDIIPG